MLMPESYAEDMDVVETNLHPARGFWTAGEGAGKRSEDTDSTEVYHLGGSPPTLDPQCESGFINHSHWTLSVGMKISVWLRPALSEDEQRSELHPPHRGKRIPKQVSSRPSVEFKFIPSVSPSLSVLFTGPFPHNVWLAPFLLHVPLTPVLSGPLWRSRAESYPSVWHRTPPLYAGDAEPAPPENCFTCTGLVSQPQIPFE